MQKVVSDIRSFKDTTLLKRSDRTCMKTKIISWSQERMKISTLSLISDWIVDRLVVTAPYSNRPDCYTNGYCSKMTTGSPSIVTNKTDSMTRKLKNSVSYLKKNFRSTLGTFTIPCIKMFLASLGTENTLLHSVRRFSTWWTFLNHLIIT